MKRVQPTPISRRSFLRYAAQSSALYGLPLGFSFHSAAKEHASPIITKAIPSTGELIPVIGMGTWITFNVGNNVSARKNCINVLDAFFSSGGRVVDSSPMYGSAEEVMGYALDNIPNAKTDQLFSASKIWTDDTDEGLAQVNDSLSLWHQKRFDLFQVHNLVNWQEHIQTLQTLKTQKTIRYLGITTSHGRRHQELIHVMEKIKPDFIQLTYNVIDREAEKNILPLAQELGIAVIANRPFQGGRLFSYVKNTALPTWAHEINCKNWAQLFLKFIVSHPAVTCAIPATSQVPHMQENMGAQQGILPNEDQRLRIAKLLR